MVSEFRSGLKLINQDLQKIKNSFQFMGLYYLTELVLIFPFPIANYFIQRFSTQSSLVFTNVIAPPVPYNFLGSKSKSMFGFVPSIGDLATGFSCISHNGIVRFGIIGDEARLSDPALFLEKYERILNKVLKGEI